jgi:hypothetical protein
MHMKDLNLIFEETGVTVVGGRIEILVPAITMVLFPRGSAMTRSNGEKLYVVSYGEKFRKDGMLFVKMILDKNPY